MGFSLTCAIYSPVLHEDPVPGVQFWYLDEVLECGRVDRRIQGVIEHGDTLPRYAIVSPYCVAGTALISLVLKRLHEYACEDPARMRAPAFLFRQGLDTFGDVRCFSEKTLAERHDSEWEVLQPNAVRLIPVHSGKEWPSLFGQYRHNQSLKNTSGSDDDFVMGKPMYWVSCQTFHHWLRDFWNAESTSRLQLRRNKRAEAKLKGWHGQVSAYAAHGAKVVFVFEDYLSPSSVG